MTVMNYHEVRGFSKRSDSVSAVLVGRSAWCKQDPCMHIKHNVSPPFPSRGLDSWKCIQSWNRGLPLGHVFIPETGPSCGRHCGRVFTANVNISGRRSHCVLAVRLLEVWLEWVSLLVGGMVLGRLSRNSSQTSFMSFFQV